MTTYNFIDNAHGSMLIEHEDLLEMPRVLRKSNGDQVFRYCNFGGSFFDGRITSAAFLSCRFAKIDWYWSSFIGALFENTRFTDCIFRGANFAACRFVNCEMNNCQFEKDNLNGSCDFDDCQWFGGIIKNCSGLPKAIF